MTSVPDFPPPTGPFPPAGDAAAARALDVRRQAREALLASDWRVVRASETNVALGTAWVTYRAELRRAASGERADLPQEPTA